MDVKVLDRFVRQWPQRELNKVRQWRWRTRDYVGFYVEFGRILLTSALVIPRRGRMWESTFVFERGHPILVDGIVGEVVSYDLGWVTSLSEVKRLTGGMSRQQIIALCAEKMAVYLERLKKDPTELIERIRKNARYGSSVGWG